MFGILKNASKCAAPARAFSTSAARADLAKLTLIGRLTKDPELRTTKNDKEFVAYTVATTNFPPPPVEANGERRASTATFHRVLCFYDAPIRYLMNLKKGTKVYVEANFELRDPEPGADPSTPQGQRQIFLRHENIRVISSPRPQPTEHEDST
ncbi:hypothetical protein BDQ17DRAFT_1421988 [Cyathus striatus]|nr:hypothetical protein BDQ17DRAFT_1421988 [Cyathus striatus]